MVVRSSNACTIFSYSDPTPKLVTYNDDNLIQDVVRFWAINMNSGEGAKGIWGMLTNLETKKSNGEDVQMRPVTFDLGMRFQSGK
jgi:hypothetical protein